MRTLLIVLAIGACAAGPVAGQTFPNALVFDTGYVAGPPTWDPWNNMPEVGIPLWIWGTISTVGAPFSGHPLPPVHELTYAFTGFKCTGSGMWDDFVNNMGGPFAQFENATLTVYLDNTPDADFGNTSTYQDGEVVLVATTTFEAVLYDGDPSQSFYTGLRFTGGAWFDDVSTNSAGWTGFASGFFDVDISPVLEILGYIGECTSTIQVNAPIATEETSWGRIKALYR